MQQLLHILAPELILVGVACILFLLGCSAKPASRRAAAVLALVGILGALLVQVLQLREGILTVVTPSLRVDNLAVYIRVLACCVGVMLLFLAWPSGPDYTGNGSLDFGRDGGEFYGLFLLSLAGLLLVGIANDLIILFLALELVSIPTYVMVSISRSSAVAQEAGVKYFFLGALSVALMLFGFSYLYGATGAINFQEIEATLRHGLASRQLPVLTSWQKLAVLLVLIGFAYKMAAFPLHFYAGDVYEGAGTPVTAFLAFVPKTAGFVALIRLLAMVGGSSFALPDWMVTLLWVIAAVTMSVGNVLGLLQINVKRVLAYSSVAHSGYMLVAIASLRYAPEISLQGVLFYLAAYGVMNAGAFGVMMLLPGRDGTISAEQYEDLAGQGRRHVALGLAMAVSCFSLIGIPLTAGFIGKVLLIKPALAGGLTWLAILLVVNAAISAAYYLRIIAVMFLRTDAAEIDRPPILNRQGAVVVGVVLSVIGTLALGSSPRAAGALARQASRSMPTATIQTVTANAR